MPYYGRQTGVGGGFTMYSGVVPTFAVGPGYSLLATCPTGKAWEIKSVWLQNNAVNKNYYVALSRAPSGWIGTPGDPLLRIFLNIRLVPEELVMFSETIGLHPGDMLWGYQLEADAGDTSAGVNMFIAGEQTRL